MKEVPIVRVEIETKSFIMPFPSEVEGIGDALGRYMANAFFSPTVYHYIVQTKNKKD